MKRFLFFIVRIFLSWTIGLISLCFAYFVYNLGLLSSLFIGAAFYYLTSLVCRKKFNQITGKGIKKEEEAYRKKELRQARLKIYKIGKSRYKIRSVYMWQTISKIYKLLLKMVAIVEKEPSRFHSVQSFFSTYLDSLALIIEKYTFLSSQPVKSQEILLTMKKTEESLEEMSQSLEKEMLQILESDVLDLDVELNVLKQSLEETTASMNHFEHS